MNKVLCFDIDNVICITVGSKYNESKPNYKAIKLINSLYKKGFIIKLFTARYMGRNKDDIKLAVPKAKKITLIQLKKWNVSYHKIFFGKPSYDIIIDDKALFFNKNWYKKLLSIL
jgi:hypothetical protein